MSPSTRPWPRRTSRPPSEVLLDGRNHGGRRGLVADGHARAPPGLREGGAIGTIGGQCAAAEPDAHAEPAAMADHAALASRGAVESGAAPSAALQNDVNGFPRAGAIALLDRDIHYLFSGINPDFGGPPLQSAHGLLVEDARRAETVRLAGLSLLGRISGSSQPRIGGAGIRPPPTRVIGRRGPAKFFRTDEAAVRKAHQRLLGAHSLVGGRGISLSDLVAFGDE